MGAAGPAEGAAKHRSSKRPAAADAAHASEPGAEGAATEPTLPAEAAAKDRLRKEPSAADADLAAESATDGAAMEPTAAAEGVAGAGARRSRRPATPNSRRNLGPKAAPRRWLRPLKQPASDARRSRPPSTSRSHRNRPRKRSRRTTLLYRWQRRRS